MFQVAIDTGFAAMSVKIFLSTVSDEFGEYRDQLRHDLTRHNVEDKIQEDFKDYGGVTLDKLDLYIDSCDAVIHLVGDMTGSDAKPASTQAILTKCSDIGAPAYRCYRRRTPSDRSSSRARVRQPASCLASKKGSGMARVPGWRADEKRPRKCEVCASVNAGRSEYWLLAKSGSSSWALVLLRLRSGSFKIKSSEGRRESEEECANLAAHRRNRN
jgi:Domain of unknown function (DUF4062)